jgi:hypothetical protein
VPGRDGLADAGNAITQADVSMVTAGVTELGETKILLRHDEPRRRRRVGRVSHSLK